MTTTTTTTTTTGKPFGQPCHTQRNLSNPLCEEPLHCLLRRCSTRYDFDIIHGLIVKRGRPSSQSNALLLNAAVKIDPTLNLPSRLFSTILCPDLSAFRIMVRAHANGESPADALLMYRKFRRLYPVSDDHQALLAFVTKSCTRLNRLEDATAIHGHIVKTGLECDVYAATAMVHAYAALGCVDNARKLFDEMTERNVVTWNALITGYCIATRADDARQVFDDMPVERTSASWNAMISGYVQNELHKEALALFHEMQLKNVDFDAVTLISALSACAGLGSLTVGEWLHQLINRVFKCFVVSSKQTSHEEVSEFINGSEKNQFNSFKSRNQTRKTKRGINLGSSVELALGNALIDMYCKCGHMDRALAVFDTMSQKSVVSWTSMIDGCALHGEEKMALHLFAGMKKAMMIPNAITFVAVLRACSHSGLVNEALLHFDEMITRYGIKPKLEHYGCMIDLYCRAGMLDDAFEFMMNMPIKPDIVAWRNLLSACKIHGNHKLGQVIGEFILERGMHREEGLSVIVSDVHALNGGWEDVVKIRKQMKGNKRRKTPGCSSIEVNNVVHEFVSGDTSHPNTYEIYDTVTNLTKIIRHPEDYIA